MRRCSGAGQWAAAFLAFFALVLCVPRGVFAISSQSQTVITSGLGSEWDDGAKVTRSRSGSGANGQMDVQADTGGLKKGYYTVYLYDQTARSVGDDDGISFHFQNRGGAALKANLVFAVDSGTSVTMTDGSFAILESDNKSIRESVSPVNGTILIPAGFNGTVYVPFIQLHTSSGKSVSLSRIQSWGITAVSSENQKARYQIGNIQLLSGSVAAMLGSYYDVSMTGGNTITIPRLGSTMETFQVTVRDLKGNAVAQAPVFYLKKSVPGVMLSQSGELQVDSSCTAASVTVGAKLANSVTFAEQTVTLKRGTAPSGETGIPKASIVPTLTKPAFIILNRYIWPIRIGAAAAACLLALMILRWFRDGNRNYLRIRKKLYDLSPGHEGEEKP